MIKILIKKRNKNGNWKKETEDILAQPSAVIYFSLGHIMKFFCLFSSSGPKTLELNGERHRSR